MQSHRPRRSPLNPPLDPPPPIFGKHNRTPSTSSASSTSSHHSEARTLNPGFTVFPNSSTSTIKLVPNSPPTPTQKLPTRQQPRSVHSSPNAGSSRPGLLEPMLMPQAPAPANQAASSSTAAATYAMQASQRKRSATEPSPTSPPITSNLMSSQTQAGAAANAVFSQQPRVDSPAPVNIPPAPTHAIPHPPPLPQTLPPPALPPPSASAPPTGKKESTASKMKIFIKPSRAGTPVGEKALRPPPSPNKLSHLSNPLPSLTRAAPTSSGLVAAAHETRRPSFSSTTNALIADATSVYSSSPPASLLSTFKESVKEVKESHSHKPHFLRPRRDKDHTFSSSASNSKTDGSSLYSFGPSSPSSSVFALTPKPDGGATTTKKPTLKLHSSPMPPDDPLLEGENPWHLLRARIQPLFSGNPLRNTVEDLNRLVTLHIKHHIQSKLSPIALLDDVRSLLEHGMATIDPHLAELHDTGLITRLVQIWALVFGYTTPYLEAVFLPLQQELKGCGAILSPRESREWFGEHAGSDVRRMIMIAFRDVVVLRLRDRLRVLFSRLQMDFSRSQKEATEVVGRMLQCVSVLGSVQTGDEKQKAVEELAATLKHNWLGRGRTGRNRRGFVGTKQRVVGV